MFMIYGGWRNCGARLSAVAAAATRRVTDAAKLTLHKTSATTPKHFPYLSVQQTFQLTTNLSSTKQRNHEREANKTMIEHTTSPAC